MNTIASSAPNKDTWQPSWKRNPEFNTLLGPYSTAAVVGDGERSQPELWDISSGCILWLPPKADVGETADPNLAKRHPAFFNHPILVISIEITNPRSAIVHFALMTSLGKRSLGEIEPNRQDRYLPIYPTEPHPNSGILLRLEDQAPKRGMIGTSYLCIRDGVFSVDFRALRCYSAGRAANGYRYRLTQESFNQVMRVLDRIPSAWIETNRLWEQFLLKHVPSEA